MQRYICAKRMRNKMNRLFYLGQDRVQHIDFILNVGVCRVTSLVRLSITQQAGGNRSIALCQYRADTAPGRAGGKRARHKQDRSSLTTLLVFHGTSAVWDVTNTSPT